MINQQFQDKGKDMWKFYVFSIIGIISFFIPIQIGKDNTILVDHIHLGIRSLLGDLTAYYALIIIIIGAILPVIRMDFKKSFTDCVLVIFKLLGAVIGIMYVFKIGPKLLFDKDYGPFLFDKLMLPLSVLIPVGAIALSFLVGYGLLEFIGVLMQPIMRPIFKTPGKSAVDAVASFVGSYSLGLLITNRVYKDGMYNKKEAVIIATGFSTVSATFMVIVARTLDLMGHWNLFFWSTLIITFVVTAISAHLPPISRESEAYYNNQEGQKESKVKGNYMKAAYDEAKKQSYQSLTLFKNIGLNLKDGVEMTMAILPSILSIGFLGLILANFTPIIDWLSYIFFSALIPCILATDIKIPIWKLVVIWFIRVALTLLIAIPLSLLIF
ncbi:YjiH family protein [Mammaliicoccus lentus]|uniref:YjiH family protein n=1 Tax=Mammaliicoccus lentus TaxID=42858 RepID=UPI002B257F1D|nr:YjiH family protein [Mammaliicoccus lentus]WQK50143.1 YjiH family protein [Mammaliicoccus lentus]